MMQYNVDKVNPAPASRVTRPTRSMTKRLRRQKMGPMLPSVRREGVSDESVCERERDEHNPVTSSCLSTEKLRVL
jgi:hypothetical protein